MLVSLRNNEFKIRLPEKYQEYIQMRSSGFGQTDKLMRRIAVLFRDLRSLITKLS